MELSDHETEALKRVTDAHPEGYKAEFKHHDKTEWRALTNLRGRGLVEEKPGGPRGGKRWFLTTASRRPEDVIGKVEWTVTALDLCPEDQAAECKRNGHRDTGRGVCADCGETLDTGPEPKPLPGLSLVLTADGGVKLS